MDTLALVIAGVLALLAALLALPVEFAFRASLSGPAAAVDKGGRFRWAFGLVDVPLRGGQGPRGPTRKRKQETAPRKKTRSRFPIGHLVLNPSAWERASTLLTRLVRAVHVRTLRFHARFGLDDPADTGQLWGVAGSMLFMLPSHLDVAIDPVFDGPDLAFQSEVAIRFVPLRIVGVLAWFGLSPATWRVLWPIWRSI